MSQPEHFEMLVLGSGEGGKFLAWHFRSCFLLTKFALLAFERDHLLFAPLQ